MCMKGTIIRCDEFLQFLEDGQYSYFVLGNKNDENIVKSKEVNVLCSTGFIKEILFEKDNDDILRFAKEKYVDDIKYDDYLSWCVECTPKDNTNLSIVYGTKKYPA